MKEVIIPRMFILQNLSLQNKRENHLNIFLHVPRYDKGAVLNRNEISPQGNVSISVEVGLQLAMYPTELTLQTYDLFYIPSPSPGNLATFVLTRHIYPEEQRCTCTSKVPKISQHCENCSCWSALCTFQPNYAISQKMSRLPIS